MVMDSLVATVIVASKASDGGLMQYLHELAVMMRHVSAKSEWMGRYCSVQVGAPPSRQGA